MSNKDLLSPADTHSHNDTSTLADLSKAQRVLKNNKYSPQVGDHDRVALVTG